MMMIGDSKQRPRFYISGRPPGTIMLHILTVRWRPARHGSRLLDDLCRRRSSSHCRVGATVSPNKRQSVVKETGKWARINRVLSVCCRIGAGQQLSSFACFFSQIRPLNIASDEDDVDNGGYHNHYLSSCRLPSCRQKTQKRRNTAAHVAHHLMARLLLQLQSNLQLARKWAAPRYWCMSIRGTFSQQAADTMHWTVRSGWLEVASSYPHNIVLMRF